MPHDDLDQPVTAVVTPSAGLSARPADSFGHHECRCRSSGDICAATAFGRIIESGSQRFECQNGSICSIHHPAGAIQIT